MGNTNAFDEFLNGNISVNGDLQYIVAYFDLLNLALEINKERLELRNRIQNNPK